MPDKDEIARFLAFKHYEVEQGLTHVYRIVGDDSQERDPGEPIKLLEINQYTAPSGVMPIGFAPAPDSGIPYRCVIVEITPVEFDHLRDDRLQLPHGWSIGPEIPRPDPLGEV